MDGDAMIEICWGRNEWWCHDRNTVLGADVTGGEMDGDAMIEITALGEKWMRMHDRNYHAGATI